jgi:hypothetical protein
MTSGSSGITPKAFHHSAQGWREERAPTLGNIKTRPTLKGLYPKCMTPSSVHASLCVPLSNLCDLCVFLYRRFKSQFRYVVNLPDCQNEIRNPPVTLCDS